MKWEWRGAAAVTQPELALTAKLPVRPLILTGAVFKNREIPNIPGDSYKILSDPSEINRNSAETAKGWVEWGGDIHEHKPCTTWGDRKN